MWGIQNPFKVFSSIYQRNLDHQFNFMAVINDDKWLTFKNASQLIELIKNTKNATIENVQIRNPNNPAQFKSAKLVSFFISGV